MVQEEGDWLGLFAENFMHEISGVPGVELFQQIGSMEIDRTRADAECPCGLLAGGAANDLSQRNTLTCRNSILPSGTARQGWSIHHMKYETAAQSPRMNTREARRGGG
jgi:hypothetical protein